MRNTGAEHRNPYHNPNRITCNEVICRGLVISAVGIFACAMAVVGVILESVGIARRMHDHTNAQLSNLWETKCSVMHRSSIPYECQQCDAFNCNTTICHGERYLVTYPIFDDTKLVSWINVNDSFSQQNIEIGHEYKCYYDRSLNYQSIQWDYVHSESQAAMIGAGAGLLIAAVAVLIFLGVYIIFVERPRMKRSKRRNQMLRHLSGEH